MTEKEFRQRVRTLIQGMDDLLKEIVRVVHERDSLQKTVDGAQLAENLKFINDAKQQTP